VAFADRIPRVKWKRTASVNVESRDIWYGIPYDINSCPSYATKWPFPSYGTKEMASHTAAIISRLTASPITIQKCYLAERLNIGQGAQCTTVAYPQLYAKWNFFSNISTKITKNINDPEIMSHRSSYIQGVWRGNWRTAGEGS